VAPDERLPPRHYARSLGQPPELGPGACAQDSALLPIVCRFNEGTAQQEAVVFESGLLQGLKGSLTYAATGLGVLLAEAARDVQLARAGNRITLRGRRANPRDLPEGRKGATAEHPVRVQPERPDERTRKEHLCHLG